MSSFDPPMFTECKLFPQCDGSSWEVLGQGFANSSPRPNPAHRLFLYSLQDKDRFSIFKWWNKNQRKSSILGNLCEIQVSVSVNKVLLMHSHAHVFIACGCFCTTVTTLDRDHEAAKLKIYYLALYRKCLLTPDLRRLQGLIKVTTGQWEWVGGGAG